MKEEKKYETKTVNLNICVCMYHRVYGSEHVNCVYVCN